MIARVRDRAQFNDFQSAPRVRYGSLTVRVAPSLREGQPAVAYSIGRSVGTAVVRNRLRRQLRAWLRDSEGLLNPAHAYLVTVHRVSTQREMADAFRACLRKIDRGRS